LTNFFFFLAFSHCSKSAAKRTVGNRKAAAAECSW